MVDRLAHQILDLARQVGRRQHDDQVGEDQHREEREQHHLDQVIDQQRAEDLQAVEILEDLAEQQRAAADQHREGKGAHRDVDPHVAAEIAQVIAQQTALDGEQHRQKDAVAAR